MRFAAQPRIQARSDVPLNQLERRWTGAAWTSAALLAPLSSVPSPNRSLAEAGLVGRGVGTGVRLGALATGALPAGAGLDSVVGFGATPSPTAGGAPGVAPTTGGVESWIAEGHGVPTLGRPGNGAGPAPPSYAAGTVTALRGTEKLVRISADELKAVLPTEVAARTHVRANQPFQLRLPAGDYVLVGVYDQFPDTTTRVSINLLPTTTLRRNLPDLCK